jgi:hypothetical protein
MTGHHLRDRDGALADERDRHRMGADSLAQRSGRPGRRSRIFKRKDTHAPPSAGYVTSAPSDHYFHSQTFVVTFPCWSTSCS